MQRIDWDKYEIHVVVNENYAIDLLRTAKHITIGRHKCKIIDISRENANDSDFIHYTIEYYDVNVDNYKYGEPPVVNYLRSDFVKDNYLPDLRGILQISGAGIVTTEFSTLLDIKQVPQDAVKNSFVNTQTGINITTNTEIIRQYLIEFYLNHQDVLPFAEVLPLADGVNIEAHFLSELTGKQSVESPDISVQKVSGFDIYKCTVNFISSVINHYNYA